MSESDQEELVRRAMFLAPIDDEADRDDEDGGQTEAHKELARGEGITTEELERELDGPPGIE